MNSLLTDPANHPANKPLTAERLIRLIAELKRSLQYQNGGDMAYVIADAIKGLEELLVSREAMPVAYIFKHPAGKLFWALTDESNKGQSDVMPVYTAPPAPQSSKMSGIMPDYEGVAMTQRECYMAGKEAGLAEARKSPVIPDGYVLVPVEPTKEMIDAGWLHFMGANNPSSKGTYKAMIAAAAQEVKS